MTKHARIRAVRSSNQRDPSQAIFNAFLEFDRVYELHRWLLERSPLSNYFTLRVILEFKCSFLIGSEKSFIEFEILFSIERRK